MFRQYEAHAQEAVARLRKAGRTAASLITRVTDTLRKNPALVKKIAIGAGAAFLFGSILDCFGLNAWLSEEGNFTELPNRGVEDAAWFTDNAWSHSGIAGHVGGDGETFYFIDGDSSYISGG
ncbi:MAG: hypothetical protein AB7N71_02050 [Phycisphaerae bacterium]